jgi:hypothetical protein
MPRAQLRGQVIKPRVARLADFPLMVMVEVQESRHAVRVLARINLFRPLHSEQATQLVVRKWQCRCGTLITRSDSQSSGR